MVLSQIEKLEKINSALMERVERSMDQQGNAFSLFQTAIGLESQIRRRTDELASTLRRLEVSNRALSEAKEAAEAANVSKTRFIAAASHDVLQPLNAANLSISALADIQTTDQARQLVRQVEQSLATMDELLRTLLDISKLDSGVMKPQVSTLSLGGILSSLRSDFEPIAAARGLRIRFRPTDLYVESDRMMLRRVLQNIISNAIRYTRDGGVLVGVRRRGKLLRIDVVDTGVGIPEDQFESVFEEFHRGSGAALADFGYQAGLGLGLSIVQRMAAALGHHIAFSSVEGRGTIFHLYVPIGEALKSPAKTLEFSPVRPANNSLFGINVLVVENDSAVLQAMVTLLESWHCRVRVGTDTEEAIAQLGDTAWVPDIILADQHLDNGDLGSNTIDHARYYLRRDIPAVIITADPSDKLHARTRQVGIELMRKPLRPAELRALMTHLVGAVRVGQESELQPARKHRQTRRTR
ncbi:hybrid sensor histidine kinase/response regulator [Mesorhizobium sp. CAU 1732]|uniref:hybrid sensor histidine kinase/response regulator n=1 Tax=Mesorhizobium sp. CAU 1732 TaxID=3140358 RepID=UPI003260F286